MTRVAHERVTYIKITQRKPLTNFVLRDK